MTKDPKRYAIRNKKKQFIAPIVPLPVFLDLDLHPQDDHEYIPPVETDEERWSREYDEENPDPFEDEHASSPDDQDWDEVEDWELLGMDPDDSQEDIDSMWENQM